MRIGQLKHRFASIAENARQVLENLGLDPLDPCARCNRQPDPVACDNRGTLGIVAKCRKLRVHEGLEVLQWFALRGRTGRTTRHHMGVHDRHQKTVLVRDIAI